MRVVVIGTGLAGVAAAFAAREAGAEVVLCGGRAGASAMWSGVIELFGPPYDMVDNQDLVGAPHLVIEGSPPLVDPGLRIQRLLRRRSFHPYARLGLTAERVAAVARRAAADLGLPVVWSDGPGNFVANLHGIVRVADGAWSSLWPVRMDRGQVHCVVGFEHFPSFSADAVAASLGAQGLRARSVWVDAAGAPLASSPATAAAALEALDDAALAALGRDIATAVGTDLALLPPILGRTLGAQQRLLGALDGDGGRLGELASVHKSLHGYRLHEHLTGALAKAELVVKGEVGGVETMGQRVKAAVLADGTRVDGDAFVLATGRTASGGLPREAPLREPLLGLPLFLEGAPLEGEAHYPPTLLSPRLFDDHPLFRLGIGVNEELRPLGVDVRPALENVFAAGLVLGGTHFAKDGSAFGVGLVTGHLAGQRAAER